MQQILVTIHGVGTAGAWQEQLHHLFAPHFQHVPIKYSHYRRWGILAVPLEPWILLLGATAIAIAVIWRRGALHGWPTLGAAAAVVGSALFTASIRHVLARKAVRGQLGKALPPGVRPHLIAHSYGTFLASADLGRYPDMRYDRMIFAGSVVPRKHDWAALQVANGGAFRSLWNEIGKKDGVVPLAVIASWVGLKLGPSGVHGFIGDAARVHRMNSGFASCAACRGHDAGETPWTIHNVAYPHYTHSEHFISPRHAMTYWLPFLWGFTPVELRDWLYWAQTASLLSTPASAGPEEEVVEAQLLTRSWHWAGGTLDAYLQRKYPGVAQRLHANPVAYVAFYRGLWEIVARACEAVPKNIDAEGNDPRTLAEAKALDPRVAVAVAVATLRGSA
jgi:pimeloyl-ACP methyl ester carboxylesterase